jgi:DNA-binding transcriptional MerR regulator
MVYARAVMYDGVPMLIHELAQQTGMTAKTIRYYESIGLIPPPQRGLNRYRQYTSADVERLRFIMRARCLDLSLSEIAHLLAARDADVTPSERVLTILNKGLSEVDRRIAEMLALRETLTQLWGEGGVVPHDEMGAEE